MKDLVFKEGKIMMDIKEIKEYSEGKDVIYNVITKFDTSSGYDVSVISVSELEVAVKILKKEFLEYRDEWLKESHMEISELESDGMYYLKDGSAFLGLGDDYLSMYITVNEIVQK